MNARTAIFCGVMAAAFAAASADARARRDDTGGGVPPLDVKSSCSDAQKFSSGTDSKDSAFKGCMQDETKAKDELAKHWSSFNAKDRHDCVEQSRNPSPSYVEVLTCLQLSTDVERHAPKVNGEPVPQIGGPVAPGLTAPPPGPTNAH